MEVKFIGSDDAFGSEGRMKPCILTTDKETRFALDFGFNSSYRAPAAEDLTQYYRCSFTDSSASGPLCWCTFSS